MNKRILYGVSIAIIAALVVVGCGLFDRDKDSSPTGPAGVAGNWIASSRGFDDWTTWVAPDKDAFAVVLPSGSCYAIEYGTDTNSAYVTANASTGQMVAVIGIMPGDGALTFATVYVLDSCSGISNSTAGMAIPSGGIAGAGLAATDSKAIIESGAVTSEVAGSASSSSLGTSVASGPTEIVYTSETTYTGDACKAFGFKEMKALKVSLD
jgi:hypothetical protein